MIRLGKFIGFSFTSGLVLMALLSSCQQPAEGEDPQNEGVHIRITHPAEGSTVSSTDTIRITVEGNVRKVEIRVDSLLMKSFLVPPYQYLWLAGYWADGRTHQIQAIALDVDNNVLAEDQVQVVVPQKAALVAQLREPIANVILTNPDEIVFSWNSVAEAKQYVLHIARQQTFQQLVRQEVITPPNVSLTLPDAGQYYWRVRAVHTSGKAGPWSEIRALEIRRVVEARFSSIQALVFDKRCAIPNCHIGEYAAQGLDLSRGNSYEHLVYVKSFEVPSMFLVEPYASQQSYLITKLEGGDSLQGALMPLTGSPLEQSVIDSIKRWIDIGAPQN